MIDFLFKGNKLLFVTKFVPYRRILHLSTQNISKDYNTKRYSHLVRGKYIPNTNIISYGNLIHKQQIHISPCFFKRRKTGEEKKVNKIFEYNKVKGDVIDVWRDITAGELAEVLQKDFQYVQDIFLNKVRSPDTIINDVKALQQAIRHSGHRMRIIGNPRFQKKEKDPTEIDVFPRPAPSKAQLKPRPPVVTVMGHVDHGKTTLLDALRHSRVVDQEFGGITQHIGAFSVVLDSGATVTFLDTPGHAAFTAMRARGASVTDIVVLVVAADDGVMEQTIESIKMARETNVPILVAINKVDSPKADIARTEEMLVEVGIQVEKLGGDVQAIPISALKKLNLNQLTEALVVQAELLEIGADPTGPVEATVVESKIHPHRGKLCTVVVQRGTLKKGAVLVAGTSMGRVRVLRDADNHILDNVSPGYPAEIEGWKDLPSPGELVLEVESEKRARDVVGVRKQMKEKEKGEESYLLIAEKRAHHQKEYEERLNKRKKLGRYKLKPEGPRKREILESTDTTPIFNLIVKSDVDGTLEALLDTLDTYDDPECKMDLVHYAVGAVTENDIELAVMFKAIIYAFNVNCLQSLAELAEREGVEIKTFNVIYKLIDDVKNQINNKLPQKESEEILGEASVLQQFIIDKGRKEVPVAGCRCTKGVLRKTAMYRLIRGEEVLHTGQLASMKHLKQDVDVIKNDTECGLQLMDSTIKFEPGDKMVCFQKRMEPQTTQWDPGF